jgi:hypothetical protein
MELNDVLRRVRALIDKAMDCEDPKSSAYNTTEAKAYHAKADALMHKYAIEDAELEQAKPVAEQRKPARLMIKLCDQKNPARPFLVQLADSVARYCRCRTMLYGYGYGKTVQAGIFGFQSDLSFFEILFTTVFLHLGNALAPKWDEYESEQENIVRLHHMGLNWLDIGRIKPDVMWDGNQSTASQTGSRIKAAYFKWCKANDETPVATGNRIQWIKSFAQFYVSEIQERLWALQGAHTHSTALVLRSEGLDEWMQDQFPETKTVRLSGHHRTNWDAAEAGRAKAREADLTGGRGGVSGSRTALPS